jgi:metal-responsive CopG/Arc/MetJ family transcriptional regulator
MMWCMKRTNIYLDEQQAELLDGLARAQGVSRAEMIRRLLDRSLRNEVDDVAAGLAAIDESFGVLADTQWTERRAGDREEHLARMWAIGS